MKVKKIIYKLFLRFYSWLSVGNYNMLDYNLSLSSISTIQYNKYLDFFTKRSFKSDLYRSIAQYNCQMAILSFPKRITINFLSFCILLLVPPFIIVASIVLLFRKNITKVSSNIAVMAEKINPELVPFEIVHQYNLIPDINVSLSVDFKMIQLFIRSFPVLMLRPYFSLKVFFKLSKYSSIISRYHPKAILTFTEYSFTSSFLTSYLESLQVKHIYFMDGEKLLGARSCFFRFTEAWVWDAHYINLFKRLYAYDRQFKIGMPVLHKRLLELRSSINHNKKILKYFWASDARIEVLKFIYNNLVRLQQGGLKIVIRGHPRHMEQFNKIVKPVFQEFEIEDPLETPFFESFNETSIVLSSYSTSLYEAVLAGKKSVIVDYNNDIDILRKLDYMLVIENKVIPLSDFKG